MFEEAMLKAGYKYLIFKDVSPENAHATGIDPPDLDMADPINFRFGLGPGAEPSVTAYRLGVTQENTERAGWMRSRFDDSLKVVQIQDTEDFMFEMIGNEQRKQWLSELEAANVDFDIYENIWEGTDGWL